jgi:hypothetical protein
MPLRPDGAIVDSEGTEIPADVVQHVVTTMGEAAGIAALNLLQSGAGVAYAMVTTEDKPNEPTGLVVCALDPENSHRLIEFVQSLGEHHEVPEQ